MSLPATVIAVAVTSQETRDGSPPTLESMAVGRSQTLLEQDPPDSQSVRDRPRSADSESPDEELARAVDGLNEILA